MIVTPRQKDGTFHHSSLDMSFVKVFFFSSYLCLKKRLVPCSLENTHSIYYDGHGFIVKVIRPNSKRHRKIIAAKNTSQQATNTSPGVRRNGS